MHHKLTGPKSTRAGWLLCKPHKRQGPKLSQRQPHPVHHRAPVPHTEEAEAASSLVLYASRWD